MGESYRGCRISRDANHRKVIRGAKVLRHEVAHDHRGVDDEDANAG